MIPACELLVPTNDDSLLEFNLTFSEDTLSNTHLYSWENFSLDFKDLETSEILAFCVTTDLKKGCYSAKCNINDVDKSWVGLLCHVDYQKTLAFKINALMYWIYQPLQEHLIKLPRCYTVSDFDARDAHCVVIGRQYDHATGYLAIAVMVICDLHPHHGSLYKLNYPKLNFDPTAKNNRIGRVQIYTKVCKYFKSRQHSNVPLINEVNEFIKNICPKLSYCPTVIDFCYMEEPIVMNQTTKSVAPVPIKVEDDQDKLCCICIDKTITHIVTPCGHYKYCADCVKTITKCSICNQQIADRFKVY